MEHLLLKAATTAATDQGTFEAVISTPSVDRDKDIVEPSAMVNALTKWANLGKLVPLAWAHTDEVVGHVDASTVRVANGEVIVKGWVDQSIPRGEEAWRLVKSGTLSFSFGFLIPAGGATKRPGGRFHIKELDVFEISVVPVAPANNDTRVLSFKGLEASELSDSVKEWLTKEVERIVDERSATQDPEAGRTDNESVDPLRKYAQNVALDVRSGGLSTKPPRIEQAPEPAKPEPDLDPDELRKRSRDLMLQVLSGDTSHE